MDAVARYDPNKTYQWNYENAPAITPNSETQPNVPTTEKNTPEVRLGIAAGPLLNGKWVLHYANLGFDDLTYKTVRSRPLASYPLPNLVHVPDVAFQPGAQLNNSPTVSDSWAISFGMPSMHPDQWRSDVEWTRKHLPAEKSLTVSVVATAEDNYTLDDIAQDYARCARWAVESGADAVEVNFSCPNVSSVDGQLYQQAQAAAVVASQVRHLAGQTPLWVKIGLVEDTEAIEQLVVCLNGIVDGIVTTNCISARVASATGQFFDGAPRGIGGSAILAGSIRQVARFHKCIARTNSNLKIIGVGGISNAQHVLDYQAAGACAVQLATAAMLDPLVAMSIKHELALRQNQPSPMRQTADG
ncbi:MAG: hypothetical protein KDB22_05960 [Planctomycetales bacterium]|nr:hypothetical protein [Planctomycetales bacterium]